MPETRVVEIVADENISREFLLIPKDFEYNYSKRVITLNVVLNCRNLGEIREW